MHISTQKNFLLGSSSYFIVLITSQICSIRATRCVLSVRPLAQKLIDLGTNNVMGIRQQYQECLLPSLGGVVDPLVVARGAVHKILPTLALLRVLRRVDATDSNERY